MVTFTTSDEKLFDVEDGLFMESPLITSMVEGNKEPLKINVSSYIFSIAMEYYKKRKASTSKLLGRVMILNCDKKTLIELIEAAVDLKLASLLSCALDSVRGLEWYNMESIYDREFLIKLREADITQKNYTLVSCALDKIPAMLRSEAL